MHSFAQRIKLDCPQCQHHVEAELWTIVDITERPDLLERIRARQLHNVMCPNCGFAGVVAAPLLVFRPATEPHLLFSPAFQTEQDNDQEAIKLLSRLRESLGIDWQEAWQLKGLPIVPPLMLPAVLSDDPERALQELAKQQEQELEALRLQDPLQYLEITLSRWLRTNSLEHKRLLLEKTPEILSDASDKLLSQMVADAKEKKDLQLYHILKYHQKLQADCRQSGLAIVFSQMESKQTTYEGIPVQLWTVLKELQTPSSLSEIPQRIELCRQAIGMLQNDFDPWLWGNLLNMLAINLAKSPQGSRADNLEQAIQYFISAVEVRTRREYPEEWADTQHRLANIYLQRIHGEQADNLELAIQHYSNALEVWTPRAFPLGWAASQTNLGGIYIRRIYGEQEDNIEQAIQHSLDALKVYTRQEYPEEWAGTQHNLANAYVRRVRGERADNIEQAIQHYTNALAIRTRQDYPEEWAGTQQHLARSYLERIHGEQEDNIEQAIQHSLDALEVYTRQEYPEDWASTQHNLANAYVRRVHGERADNIEQAIQHYTNALEVYTRQEYPEDWARTLNNLGGAYVERVGGERADNIEQAIQHYTNALAIRTRQEYPEEWAGTQHNLADAYVRRVRGERADNIEQAIQHYTNALAIRTRQDYPEEWAGTQHSLASAYLNRIRSERADNIEQAIQHSLDALEVYTRQEYPEEWASTQHNLAIAYVGRVHGERADNIEQAIQHYTNALEVYTRQEYPEDWATTQHNLAGAYLDRIRSARADNIEQAIQHMTSTLEVYTRQKYPEDWASTQYSLGSLFMERRDGERANNLEQAIQHIESALEVYTRQTDPEEWAKTQHNLATAYLWRIHGERADNIEQSIQYHTNALDVYKRRQYPENWALIQNDLAVAYRNRIRGERAENIEQAIHHYANALEVYTRQEFPEEWARTLNNLGGAYIERVRGERADNIEQAIQHFTSALEVRTRQSFPEQWATTQSNLANAYADRIHGERADNIELAIQHYINALEVDTRQEFPEEWARIHNNLATVYPTRVHGDKADNIELSIQHFTNALEVRTRQSFPNQWATTQSNLAIVYAERVHGERADNVQRALQYYTNAIELQQDPVELRQTGQNAGRLAAKFGYWQVAANAFFKAVEADQSLFDASFSSKESREVLLQRSQYLYPDTAYALVRAGDLQKAAEVIESGRARQMRETLERNRRDLQRLPELGFEVQADAYMKALHARENLLTMSEENRAENWLFLLGAATNTYEQAAADIRDKLGIQYPEFRYFMRTLPFQVIQSQAHYAPLVYLYAAEHNGMALIITMEGVHAVELVGLTRQTVYKFVIGEENDNTYLRVYSARRKNEKAFADWLGALEVANEWAWQYVLNPVMTKLKQLNLSEAVLIPTGPLTFLPLHTAASQDAAYVCDSVRFTYAPMARGLLEVREKAEQNPADSLLAVDNPNPTGWLHLPSSNDEMRAVRAGFDGTRTCYLHGDEATRQRILEEMDDHAVLHFSTHGFANFEKPLESGILVAGGAQITLRDFLDLKLEHVRLAVLSACETGIPGDLDRLDEIVSLPSGLMQAGVPAVIGTLWSVPDVSTAILMARFYELWRNHGLAPAEALRQSQYWLRTSTVAELQDYFKKDLKEFENQKTRMPADPAGAFFKHVSLLGKADDIPFWHPYFWAGFTYTGI